MALSALMLTVGVVGGLWLHSVLGEGDGERSVPSISARSAREDPSDISQANLSNARKDRQKMPMPDRAELPPASAGLNRPRQQVRRDQEHEARSSHSAPNPGKTLDGITIAVDPGHNGGNASHPEVIDRPVVAAADGATKACNTTGTETNDGRLTEAEFNFYVGEALKRKLIDLGARVILTRNSNAGVGPCVNERAEVANRAGAAALISIHADGNETEGAHGFDVIHALTAQMVEPSESRPSSTLAESTRAALVRAGIPPANYVGEDGLDTRSDLGGLNLARVPAVLVELGNMRSADEAQQLESPSYRMKLAQALAAGVVKFISAGQR